MILVDGLILDEKPTGLGRYAKRLSEELAKKHKDVIFMFREGVEVDIPEQRIIRVSWPLQRKNPRVSFWARFLWKQLFFFEEIKKVSKNSLIFHTIPETFFLTRMKEVIVVHDIIPLLFREMSPRVFYYYRYVLPKVMRKACHIIAVSYSTKNDLVKHYEVKEEKISVVHSGIDPPRFSNRELPVEGPFVLFVGAFRPGKNVERLFKAFSLIKDRIAEKLVLAGSGFSEFEQKLRKLACELGIKDRVNFLGYLKEDSISFLYRRCNLFVFPSLYEGFGFPVLEAMAAGAPVIATNVSSVPEIAGDAALFFNPRSPEDIAEKMLKVLSSESLKEELRRKGKERAKLFRWEKTASKVLEILKSFE